jgi:serine/threonine protein kinase
MVAGSPAVDSSDKVISHLEIAPTLDSSSTYIKRKVVKDALYGQILSATVKGTGENVVLKQLLRECVERKVVVSDLKSGSSSKKCIEDARVELSVLRRLNKNGGHPNVIRLHNDFETRKHLVMVMDYLSGGDLFDRVMSKGKLAESIAQNYFMDVLRGLDFIHSHDIAHRDLSLENLLLDAEDRLVIIDFGLCCECSDGQKQTQRVGKGFYIAPEIFNKAGPYDPKKADVWSLGIILFIMITGKPPMERPAKQDKRFNYLVEGKMADLLRARGQDHLFSNDCLGLLSQMLCVDPSSRVSLGQVLAHPWIQSAPSTPNRKPKLQVDIEDSPISPEERLPTATDPLFPHPKGPEEPHSARAADSAKLNSYLNSFTVSGVGGSHLAKELQRAMNQRECAF